MMLDTLRAGLRALGLDEAKAEPLALFADLVLERNRVMNLTAITDPADFARLHLLDSAALLGAVEISGRVIDVGTGAGFPGVPLAILRDDLRITLLDSTRKRIAFLEDACAALALSNAGCVCARAETLDARERYNVAVSRAVAAMNILCELCLPLVRVGGRFVAMKSVGCDPELDEARHAIEALGGRFAHVTEYPIPGCDVIRRAVVIEKIAPTPARYPRPFGQIRKRPL